MTPSVSKQCQTCITTLKTIISTLSEPNRNREENRVRYKQVNDGLERLSLWTGNIGALHRPESSMSLELRLREASDVLTNILDLLGDLKEVAGDLLEISSGKREAFGTHDNDVREDKNEETELFQELNAYITRLFRVSYLIRQAAPADLFTKALSRDRYKFNNKFDIAHVREKYPKLATEELAWLRERLGRAITHRRQYLSYIQDHPKKLEGSLTQEETTKPVAPKSQAPITQPPTLKRPPNSSANHPSIYDAKTSNLTPDHSTPQMLAVQDESDPENDSRPYTTISRTVDGDYDFSATAGIPKLDDLQTGFSEEVECPFCFRVKKFKHERVWQQHVFSDLRSYVCTFRDCDAPYFSDINDWFHYEMQNHRVSYSCQLCQSKPYPLKEHYLAHVRERHPEVLQNSEEESVLHISRRPLAQIPAHDCPCCSDWIDRLKGRAEVASMPSNAPDHITSNAPAVFKHHLASHLEQLALFAIRDSTAADGKSNSDVAVEEYVGVVSGGSDLPNLSYGGARPTSPASQGRSQGKRMDRPKLSHDGYTVALIAPIQVEQVAAMLMLDERHEALPQPPNDHNVYTLGSINNHNVVIASLPTAGNCSTATVVTQMRTTFRRLRFGLLVGIGGGVPTETNQGPIRLGHVVVGTPEGQHSGAVQYDHGKAQAEGRFTRTGVLAPPPSVLLASVHKLTVKRCIVGEDPLLVHLQKINTKLPRLQKYKYPGAHNDHLYPPSYLHLDRKRSCRQCGCSADMKIDRGIDESESDGEYPTEIVAHHGIIAAGEMVMQDAQLRDKLAEQEGVLCFEMEAAGALNDFPCLVIRGISDYSDSHKNDDWHGYAAAAAAAYARDLFFHMSVDMVMQCSVAEAGQ